ncbi:OLC1v1033862C1 [Oldenlandia corymbosa var. corymbosa]|uniref:OLC1v1033862C1 n=1 Tax=Oldenlandia corymbosa var. corymbosa TaxID=529605 RepID=A0AAV1CPX7_OLDCO|nr:OLC1v1033862C1 [Oldenlandia corymbosa var. corymbosa]
MDSIATGVGSKSKPCTKFFSTAGCPFGESCHFLHYVPGGYNTVAQMMNLPPAPVLPSGPRNIAGPPSVQTGSAPTATKTKLCNKYNTAEGCKFGDKCHFAHGDWELGKPIPPSPPHSMGGPLPGSRFVGRMEPPPVPGPAASFGASATAKISVNASLAGAIIGKSGVNSKHICRQTGVKLSIRDHESDPNLRNIELEGTFEQIQQASTMVRELISSLGHIGRPERAAGFGGGPAAPPGNNFKTKLCENFAKGSCTFGERCHFAHGAAELRKSAVISFCFLIVFGNHERLTPLLAPHPLFSTNYLSVHSTSVINALPSPLSPHAPPLSMVAYVSIRSLPNPGLLIFPISSKPVNQIFQRFPNLGKNGDKVKVSSLFTCKAMVAQTAGVQGASAAYAKEMERLSAKESLLLAFKDAGEFEALVTGKTTDVQRIDVNERIVGLERLNPTPRPTTSPYLEGRWDFKWIGDGSPEFFVAKLIFERFPTTIANLSKLDLLVKDGYATITASLKFVNSIESKVIITTRLSVEGPLRLKEEYVEGIFETPKINEDSIPEQLKGAFGQAVSTVQQLPAPIRDVASTGLKVPLGAGNFQRLFMISYLDDEFLIIRDANGVPEVLTRLDPAPSPMEGDSITEYES